jgi:hypothetical protein
MLPERGGIIIGAPIFSAIGKHGIIQFKARIVRILATRCTGGMPRRNYVNRTNARNSGSLRVGRGGFLRMVHGRRRHRLVGPAVVDFVLRFLQCRGLDPLVVPRALAALKYSVSQNRGDQGQHNIGVHAIVPFVTRYPS